MSSVVHGSSYDSPEGFCVAQHAEAGALLYSDGGRRMNGTLVVNGPPCFECARLIASAGIRRVVHFVDDAYEWRRVREFLIRADVEVVSCGKNFEILS
jgi:deoxycytidylate deaminase